MRIHVARPEYRFSCAHMTVFDERRKERLHGHNYTVGVAVELAAGGAMLEFAALKEALRLECGALRERLLLPGTSPHFVRAAAGPGELEFRLCGERYVVPEHDALILPIDNVTVEGLAGYLLDRLSDRLEDVLVAARATSLELTIEESPGQGARATRALG
jgi:6-pyruvoyltetrahydropterin/6-carboxytetrahydropterin synthase